MSKFLIHQSYSQIMNYECIIFCEHNIIMIIIIYLNILLTLILGETLTILRCWWSHVRLVQRGNDSTTANNTFPRSHNFRNVVTTFPLWKVLHVTLQRHPCQAIVGVYLQFRWHQIPLVVTGPLVPFPLYSVKNENTDRTMDECECGPNFVGFSSIP